MQDETEKWQEAEEYLRKCRAVYASIGIAGMPCMQLVLNPLLIRLESGERSEDLYREIMELE